MDCFIGIDLGSTTTKAMILDENLDTLGRGITNSRSNYETATSVAKQEAVISARLTLFQRELDKRGLDNIGGDEFLDRLEQSFRLEQFLEQLEDLHQTCLHYIEGSRVAGMENDIAAALSETIRLIAAEATKMYEPGARRKSDFFRDIAGSRFMDIGEKLCKQAKLPFDILLNIYDKSIIEVENRPPSGDLQRKFEAALDRVAPVMLPIAARLEEIREALLAALGIVINEVYVVGTGYGRVTLPFPKEHIRSEILCHGLGAHMMYPGTRTVLDIGGQDTKGIQIDNAGIVENFQMNDRCAAGCGRYLGYIADEMNMGVHELGPLALKAKKKVRINSTCTVFAGAELRDRLALGEDRSDILGGLHRAIVLRAMSIISRSGGISNEFTFTGGVANNQSAVRELKKLVVENYGDMTINIDPNSIYTGALGAAAFARRSALGEN